MAWTYDTLKQALQDYMVTDETTFVANIPIIVKQAEDRILKKVQLPDFRKNVTGTMTASDQYLAIPTDFLAPYSLALDNSGFKYLLPKAVSFIREAYPVIATTGQPKHYAVWDDDFFLLGPTPDSNYPVELHYFYRPESIVTAGTSWIGDHAESVLLAACLFESYIFLKGDPDLMKVYEIRYKEALDDLMVLASAQQQGDQYRNG
jgi:hypothetical protein